MLYFNGFFGVLTLGLWIFCIVDVITTDEGSCRNMPKGMWLLLVLLVPLIGSIVWLVAGRPQQAARAPRGRYEGDSRRSRSTTGRAASPRRAPRTTKNSCANAGSVPKNSAARRVKAE